MRPTNLLRRWLVLGLALASLTGCATGGGWHDPVARYAERPEDCVKQPPASPPSELERARQRACEMHAAYTAAMGGAQSVSDGLNLGLLGLGAATAGLAMTGTTGIPLIALALAGATGFTANGLFVPAKDHREIFAIGAEASYCVRIVADDYLRAAGHLRKLNDAITALATAGNSLEAAIVELETVLNSEVERATPVWKAAKQLADSARTVVTEVNNTVSGANAQVRGLEVTAPGDLNRTLTAVRVVIKRAALTTSPSVAEVQSAIRAFSADVPAAYTSLMGSKINKSQGDAKTSGEATAKSRAARARATKAVVEKEQEQKREDEIEKQIQAVQTRLDEVARARTKLATESVAAAVPNAQARLQECITKAQTAPQRRPIQLGNPALSGKKGDSLHTTISGGVGPYTATLVNADPVKSDIQLPQGAIKPDENTKIADLAIVLGPKAVAGAYTVQITDVGGGDLSRPTSLSLTVTPEAKAEETEEKTGKPLSVTTPDKSVDVGKSITFTIAGGTPPYTVDSISGPGEATQFTIEPEIGTNVSATNTVTVTPTESATPGKGYKLKIRDTKTEAESSSFDLTKGGASPASVQPPTLEDLRVAQSLLKRRGYDAPLDGQMSDRTRLALGQFQATERIAVTHGLDAATRKKLGMTEQPITRADIEAAQRTLRDLRLYDAAVDGIAGPRTTDALRTFQKAQGLPETGVPDAATLDAMSRGASGQPPRRPTN